MTEKYYCPICGEVTACPHYDQARKPKKQKYNKKKYDGLHCPYCNSENISATTQVEMDGVTGSQMVECQSCGKAWNDILQVVDWEAIE